MFSSLVNELGRSSISKVLALCLNIWVCSSDPMWKSQVWRHTLIISALERWKHVEHGNSSKCWPSHLLLDHSLPLIFVLFVIISVCHVQWRHAFYVNSYGHLCALLKKKIWPSTGSEQIQLAQNIKQTPLIQKPFWIFCCTK